MRTQPRHTDTKTNSNTDAHTTETLRLTLLHADTQRQTETRTHTHAHTLGHCAKGAGVCCPSWPPPLPAADARKLTMDRLTHFDKH